MFSLQHTVHNILATKTMSMSVKNNSPYIEPGNLATYAYKVVCMHYQKTESKRCRINSLNDNPATIQYYIVVLVSQERTSGILT